MIKVRDSKICKYCGARGEHSICIATGPYLAVPFSALEALCAGNVTLVTKPKGGRPKRYETLAEKQRAYRKRKKANED
jgi:hypothetical protein